MREWNHEDIKKYINGEENFLLYLYTPMCGTCQLAGKMLVVVAELKPNLNWGKCDLNYIPEYAVEWEIESVPCLLIFQGNKIVERIYAFHSVPYLYDMVKNL